MHRHTAARLVVMFVVGVATAAIAGWLGAGRIALTLAWAVAALIYIGWVGIAVGRFDGKKTRSHAQQEEPARAISDALVVLLNVASLGSIVFVLAGSTTSTSGAERALAAALAITSAAISWTLLHTLFTLRYAQLYYRGTVGGIDFNQKEDPRYTDFAYLSFTLGMTYQVSDTDVTSHEIRSAVLGHSLLSFVFGAFILATTINLVAGLGS